MILPDTCALTALEATCASFDLCALLLQLAVAHGIAQVDVLEGCAPGRLGGDVLIAASRTLANTLTTVQNTVAIV